MTDQTFFDPPKDPELKERIDALWEHIEAKGVLTEEQIEMYGNVMTYIAALLDPEDYADRYRNTNYDIDEELPSTEECMAMQKARVADYFCD